MSKPIWLHIGTAKSGTTALQHYCNDHANILDNAGLSYITAPGHSSANKLAIAINRNRSEEIAAISSHITAEIEKADNRTILISSEMFFGMEPSKIIEAIPALRNRQLNILVYIRRQDRYIESKYLQKMKNGRFRGSIWDYIEKFDGSGSDYFTQISPWFSVTDEIHPRICERELLIDGSTVNDALSFMGCRDAVSTNQPTGENHSPSLKRIQLLQTLEDAGFDKPRRIQRSLPPDLGQKARILTNEERRAWLAGYAHENEQLCRRFFTDQDKLFNESDLDLEDDNVASGFTPDDLDEIKAVFKALIKQLH